MNGSSSINNLEHIAEFARFWSSAWSYGAVGMTHTQSFAPKMTQRNQRREEQSAQREHSFQPSRS